MRGLLIKLTGDVLWFGRGHGEGSSSMKLILEYIKTLSVKILKIQPMTKECTVKWCYLCTIINIVHSLQGVGYCALWDYERCIGKR